MDKEGAALVQSLVGRKVVRAKWFDDSPNQEWAEHERAWLWLDDGRVIQFGGWGYDASGATVEELELLDVAECIHCHQPHPDSVVFSEGKGRWAYCIDGNHRSWKESSEH